MAIATALAIATTLAAPAAAASGVLIPTMGIWIGGKHCTLGFLAYDRRQDRLGVTAGHCSEQTGTRVTADNGVPIGEVVARMDDAGQQRNRLTGSRGYTVIYLYKSFTLRPFFDSYNDGAVGDPIAKQGQRSGETRGRITNVRNDNSKRPDLNLIESDMVQLPGDSGCPWWSAGRTLVAMGSSGDQETAGGTVGSQAQPINSVVRLIRENAGRYGDGFTIWTQ